MALAAVSDSTYRVEVLRQGERLAVADATIEIFRQNINAAFSKTHPNRYPDAKKFIEEFRAGDKDWIWIIDPETGEPGGGGCLSNRLPAWIKTERYGGKYLTEDVEKEQKMGYLGSLFVIESLRRKHLGTKLVIEAESELKRQGCHSWAIAVDRDSGYLITFYEKQGYRTVYRGEDAENRFVYMVNSCID